MDLRDAIRQRRSIRAFRPDPIPDELLLDLLGLAHWAPSAGHLQSRDYVVVRDEATRRALVHLSLDQEFLAQAPVIVVACGNLRRVDKYGRRGRDLFIVQDVAVAVQNLMLAAHEAGLGTCWVGAFDEDGVRKLLGLPIHVRPLVLLPMGRPAESPEAPSRMPLDELVHWDKW